MLKKSNITPLEWVVLGIVTLTIMVIAGVFMPKIVGGIRAAQDYYDTRLSVVWPEVENMKREDHALVTYLAAHCGIKNVPSERAAVIECLRRAATDPGTNLPSEFEDNAAAANRLEALIEGAKS